MNVFARIIPAGQPVRRPFRVARTGGIVVAVVWLAGCLAGQAQALQDYFTNRISYSTVAGDFTVSNVGATMETNEPNHGGKPGGHSLWISWTAPTNGVVRFKTQSSGFDTLLGTYRFVSTNDTTLDKLLLVASADDSEGFDRESEVEFGVVAGKSYEVAVDGYRGATGPIRLRWNFNPLNFEPPTLLSTPADRSYNLGDLVSLTVGLTNVGTAQLRWYFNGNDTGVTGTNLTLAFMDVTNVGRYKLRILSGGDQYFAPFTDLQINTEGSTNTLAQSKFLDSPDTPLKGSDGGSSLTFGGLMVVRSVFNGGGGVQSLGVVRGYSGSQIFSTVNATTDPLEPVHCNAPGGKSYWLSYQPPANGTLTLDTIGSTYDTVMETYTYNGTPAGYADLISLACNNNISGTNGPSRAQFAVVKTRQYLVAVDGVGGATGTARLNYTLNTNQPPHAPSLTGTPSPINVAVGANVQMTAPVAGSPPLFFKWRKNGVVLTGATAPALALFNVTTNDTAGYAFTVTNDLGGVSGTFAVKVLVPAQCRLAPIAGGFQLGFATLVGQTYTIEDCTNLTGYWTPWPGSFVGNGLTNYFNVSNTGQKFYRVRVE